MMETELVSETLVFDLALTRLNARENFITKQCYFCDIAICTPVEICRRFRGAYCFHHQDYHRPDDGGSKRR
jgi:hypothetical protein